MLQRSIAALCLILINILPLRAAEFDLGDVLHAVVELQAQIPADARSARTLGTERGGNGVVIDDSGLILTIGYLILEAMSVTVHDKDGKPVVADLVGYDYDTGFGLVRATKPLGVKALQLGDSSKLAVKDPVLVVGHGGAAGSTPALVVSKREFAGYWEYLLDKAIFTSPPHPNWGGAALVDRGGRLVGIGSLTVGDAAGGERGLPGNMFVPINLLKPILSDMLSEGRAQGPRPAWLGMYSTTAFGRVVIAQVTPGGPADKAGLKAGDIVVSVAGKGVEDVPAFYRRIRGLGEAGVTVPLQVLRGTEVLTVPVESVDRYRFLKINRTY
jgi:S1-C subfamily serine protease